MNSLQKAVLVFVIGASVVVALWALPRYERWHGDTLTMAGLGYPPDPYGSTPEQRANLTLTELQALARQRVGLTKTQVDALSEMEQMQAVRQAYYNETTRLVIIAEVVILTIGGVAWFALQPTSQRR